MMRRTLCLALCLAAAVSAIGCGYSASSLYPPGIRTVHVQFMDNRTFRRGVEVDLTRALVGEIKLRTPLLFGSRDSADSLLTGELLSFEEDVSVHDSTGEALRRGVTLHVRFHWVDRVTGADLVPPTVVKESVRLVRGEPRNDLAVQEMAKRIVQKMQAEW
jgi:Lipopolysaccharide-assembly